ncbi:membrane-bound lytic murein transglycosylase B [Moorella thermoacetica Y72]|uniref:Membrane-bound lytic murein transglycosylase B n=1 Tax=Moorella thermoacetica Y72 TaxID=1325331 RepID=A0A0S6U733_NEOTH|nr:membrane-bound lytic murein transglycosylase B [Moorella thermoacetica Y72]
MPVINRCIIKKAATLLLCASSLAVVPVPAAAASESVKLVIDNKPLTVPAGDQGAFIMGNRTYVPLRIISEKLGARVDWQQDANRVIITTRETPSVPPPADDRKNQGEVQIIIDGKILQLPPSLGHPYITPAGRTVVPLRAVGEALGCEVNWVASTSTVEIKSATYKLLLELAGYRSNLRLLDGTVINSAELLKMDASSFSQEQLQQFREFLGYLKKYDQQVKLPDGTVLNVADITIEGQPVASAAQLRAWIASEIPRLRVKMQEQYHRDLLPIPDLAELYLRIGAEYGIRGDLAFAQAAKETNFWQFTGSVRPDQNNYCGLGALSSPNTGNEPLNGADPTKVRFAPGVYGAIFASPEIGVEAHIQHLYAYATKKPLPPGKVLYDPRFNLVQRGSATTWQGLNARWAVPGITYGQSIIEDYWLKALAAK